MNLLLLNEFAPQILAKIAVNRGFLSQSKADEYIEGFAILPLEERGQAFLKKLKPTESQWIQELFRHENPSSIQILSEEEAREKVLAGIPLENVCIPLLKLDGLTLKKPVQITHSIIHEISLQQTRCFASINFSKTIFFKSGWFGSSYDRRTTGVTRKISGMVCQQDVSFEDAVFLGEADFSEILFFGNLFLNGSYFHQGIDLRACKFAQDFCFEDGICYGKAVFQNSTFAQTLSFRQTQFFGECIFSEAMFDGLTYFQKAVFHKGAIFNGGVFEEETNFSESTFLEDTSFEDCRFKAGAEFVQSHFHNARFSFSEFQGWADFNNSFFQQDFIAVETTFERGIDFSETEVKGSIDFQKSHIRGDADFSRMFIAQKSFFEETRFFQKVSFRRARFQGPVEIHNVEVFGDFYAEETCFAQKIEAVKSKFYQSVYFQEAIFEEIADFSENFFSHPVYFSSCLFHQKASFEKASFHQEANFQNLQVFHTFNFMFVQLEKDINFSGSKFQQDISFDKTIFFQNAFFEKCVFFGKVSFTNNNFHALFSLKKADCKDKVFLKGAFFQQISFENINAEDFLVRQEQIEGKLISLTQKKYAIAKQEFGFLKKIFEHQNHYDEMDWAYYHFKECERKAKQKSTPFYNIFARIPLIWDLIVYDWGCGYCTKPFRIVVSGIVIVLLFALTFQALDLPLFEGNFRQIVFSGEEFFENMPQTQYPFEFYIYFSFCNFVAFGSGDSHANYHGLLKYGVALEAFVGLFFVTLFVTTFTRKVLR